MIMGLGVTGRQSPENYSLYPDNFAAWRLFDPTSEPNTGTRIDIVQMRLYSHDTPPTQKIINTSTLVPDTETDHQEANEQPMIK